MKARLLVGLFGMVVLIVYPFVVSPTLVRTGVLTAITVIAALGMNVVTGLAHQFSVGHAAFVGIGAYMAAYGIMDWGLPFPLAVVMATVAAGLVGLVFSPVAFKLRHLGLALTTLGLVYVFQHVLKNVAVRPKSVSDATVFGFDFGSQTEVAGLTLTRNINYYFLCVALAVICGVLTHNVLRSRTGRAMSVMGELSAESVAGHVGIGIRSTKAQAFVMSSVLAGLAGALLAPFTRVLQWQSFGLSLSVQYLAIIIIGGLGTVAGAVLGSLFVTALQDVIRVVAPSLPFVADSGASGGLTIAQTVTLAYGLLIVLLLVFQPGGLEAMFRQALARIRRGSPGPRTAATVPAQSVDQ